MTDIKHISNATSEIVDYIDKKRKGLIKELKTRWIKINKKMPIEWHCLYTIAGISGSGKSSFANELETSLFDFNPSEDFAVLSFNYEMMASRQVGRKLSFKTKKTVSELYSKDEESISDEDFEEIKKHAESIKKYSIFYVDTSLTVDQMRNTILKAVTRLKKGLVVFVDHARLVKKGGSSEQEMLSELIAMCMELKKQYKITFIVLSQLNREIEKTDRVQNIQGHYPLRSDLFGFENQ